jgi:Ca2+-binding RTX toxin-like protein
MAALGDPMYGDNGDDTMSGHYDSNYMDGGSGNDYVYGGHGGDQMWGEKPSIFTTPFGPIYRYNVIGAGVDRLDGGGGFDQGDGGPKLDFCLNLETAINCERPTEEEEDVSEEPPPGGG